MAQPVLCIALMRLLTALVFVLSLSACGGEVDPGSSPHAGAAKEDTATRAETPEGETPAGCCELGVPSCDCPVTGTRPDGTCENICDAVPVGWVRETDARGCPRWRVAAGSCLMPPKACSGIATFCSPGCAAVFGQRLDATRACVHPEATVGCMSTTGVCTGAITCKVRLTDGVAHRFNAGCSLDGWRDCTAAEHEKAMAAPACEGIDAGSGP